MPAKDEPDVESSSPYTITEEILEQRLYYHNYGRKWTQIFVGSLMFCSSLSFGMALGWGSPITTLDFAENINTFSPWLVSICPLGCCFGCLSSNYLLKNSGPKKSIQIQAPLFVISWWFLLVEKDELQLSVRFFLGFFGICLDVGVQALLKQCLHYRFSKFVSEFSKSAIVAGIFITNCIGHSTSPFYLTMICAGLPTLSFCLISFLPESPVFLYETNIHEARKSLIWYRGENNIHLEMMIIRRNWERSRFDETNTFMIFSKVIVRALIVIVGLVFFQTTSHYHIFLFYGVRFWNNRFIVSPLIDVIVVSAIILLSKLFWSFVHGVTDEWRVRPALIVSSGMVTFGLTLLATYYFMEYELNGIDKNFGPMVVVVLIVFFQDWGLNYYPNVLLKSYIPYELLTIAELIMQCVFWFCLFCNCYVYGRVRAFVIHYVTFTIYGVISLGGVAFIYYFVVETKNASLIQMQAQFGGNPVGSRGQSNRWITEMRNRNK